MPITKLGWVEKPKALERYLAKQRDSATIESSSHGLDGKMAEGLREEHARFQDSSRIQGMTIIQSWKEEDRHLYPAEKFNEMGQELASRLAPGHAAWVFTHTDKDNIHNHIVICSVHADTGKRIENKKALLFKMRELNDDIARENDFKTLDPSWKEKGDRLPARARAMVANGKSTWRHALNEKANFVRAFSTSFDEYAGTLKTLGVHVRVEDKNISYVYGDRKAIRGKSLGTKYTKEGLIKAFKENDERIASNPALRNIFANHLSDYASGKSTELAGGTFAVAHRKKDYEAFTKVSRARTREEIPEIFKNAGILAQEFKTAQDKSIFDYCKANKIGLLKDRAGNMVLTGRESIVVEDKRWKNTKNHDSGGLIEFVKLHDDSNFLRAVAKINNNPRLLLLESVIGEYSKGYRSFHFPKEKKAQTSVAEKVATQFLKDTGRNSKHARKFADDSRLMVTKNHSIWLRSDRDSVAMEMSKEENGTWKKRSNGNVRGGFSESIKHSPRMTVFTDPFDFVLNSKGGKGPHNPRDSFFVMSDESSRVRLHEILFANPHIKEVQLVSPPNISKGRGQPQLFNDLKSKLTPFDIQVRELSIEGLSLGFERSKSPDR